MSRDHRRSRRSSVPVPILILGLVLLAVVGYRFFGASQARAATHPDPRPDVTAEHVVVQTRYASHPEIARVYGQATEIPEILDGLYCHCDCSTHAGHRSLLTCFESDHGARCDICLGEAALAHRMATAGASLDEIREEIDRTYGR